MLAQLSPAAAMAAEEDLALKWARHNDLPRAQAPTQDGKHHCTSQHVTFLLTHPRGSIRLLAGDDSHRPARAAKTELWTDSDSTVSVVVV